MTEYIAAGANRHPAVADWYGSILAYGSDRNIALWNPQESSNGVEKLLVGHTDTVNSVKFLHINNRLCIISGSVDKTVRVWVNKDKSEVTDSVSTDFECIQVLDGHKSSINCITVTAESSIFATGSADATVNVWGVQILDGSISIVLQQTIKLAPRFFPLALALSSLNGAPGSYVLAAAGTAAFVQLFIADSGTQNSLQFELKATLSGHEGWIRSLAFTSENDEPSADLLLSSASQDKYIRLWRIHQGKELPKAAASGSDPALVAFLPGKSLSNKAHRFVANGRDFSATFEALLLGHEDWIYSTVWKHRNDALQLLSASADNSLSIWEQDASTGVWISVARLGEISAQKGSTTATGSTGGFWTGLWSPDGTSVVCVGRTGSWRLWNYDSTQDRWNQGIGIGGHTQSVTGIAWSKMGDYLLSTSLDQTTRLHARWKHEMTSTWHEMARPQIHGYDLTCIDSLGQSQFVSGAEEKLLRVFNEPKAVADLLQKLCGIEGSHIQDMPDAANMPVLGLSNKAIDAIDDDAELENTNRHDREALDPASMVHKSTLIMDHPPLEDHLSRHTLWPEAEKLYGHGYEISALASSHDGTVIATACRASSIDHAVIRLFQTSDWTEIKPPLTAHSLTVTRLRFSADDKYLLSVGRDRQWAVFARTEGPQMYELAESNPKGHSRMILDAAWAPQSFGVFATAGRDKQVKLWAKDTAANEGGYICQGTIPAEAPVTAIDFAEIASGDNTAYLAVGTETGKIAVYTVELGGLTVLNAWTVDSRLSPTRPITQLSWRPTESIAEVNGQIEGTELAVASEDCSLRVYSLGSLLAASSKDAAVC